MELRNWVFFEFWANFKFWKLAKIFVGAKVKKFFVGKENFIRQIILSDIALSNKVGLSEGIHSLVFVHFSVEGGAML